MAAVISPGDDKAGVRSLKGRGRRLVLMTACIGIDPEVPTQNLRRRQRLAFLIGRGEDLAADVVAGTRRTVVLVRVVRTALVITPGDDELAVTEIRHRRLVLGATIRIGIDQEVVANLRAGSIKPLTEHVDTAAAVMVAAFVITPGDDKATVRQR